MPVMRDPVRAFVGLGANLGAAAQTVRQALRHLAALPDTSVVRCSGLWGSAPLQASGPDYVNAVAELATGLCAPALLQALQALEQTAGRVRSYRNAPRTLDLDVLLYGSARIDSPTLTVPHPRMGERAFVLLPLEELAPELLTPAQRQAVRHQSVWRLPD